MDRVRRVVEWIDRSEWDDDHFFWRHDVLTYLLTELVGGLIALPFWLLFGETAAIVALFGVGVALIASGVIRRRRRNRR